MKSEVLYLRHCLSENKIIPLHHNTLFIKEFPRSSNIKSLQKFLEKVNFYHKFIVKSPKILHSLYDLLKKRKRFSTEWDIKLGAIVFAINTNVNKITKESLFSLMHRFEPRTILDNQQNLALQMNLHRQV